MGDRLGRLWARARAISETIDRRLGHALGTRVSFDDAVAHAHRTTPTDQTRVAVAMGLVLAMSAGLMLFRLGAAEICGFNEAVEALVVQHMVAHGITGFPTLNDAEPTYKPPLFHIVATLLARLTGSHEASEITVRLPSVLFGLGGLAMVMLFAVRWLGAHAAILAGLVLMGSYQWISQARYGRVDMTLAFMEFATLLLFLGWVARIRADAPARAWHWALAIVAGVSVLAKGPVGALLPAAAIGMTLVLTGRWDLVRRLLSPAPLVTFLVLASGWYVAGAFGEQDALLTRHLGSENLARFTGGLGRMPHWYYVGPLLLNSVPFSLLVPLAVVAAFRSRGATHAGPQAATEPTSTAPTDRPDRAVEPALLFAVFWVLTVVFFSFAAYKRRAYLLPLWPPAALLLAWWIEGIVPHRYGRQLRGGLVGAAFVMAAINFVYIPLDEVRDCPPGRFRAAAHAIGTRVGPADALFSHGFPEGSELSSLVYYLGRTAPPLSTHRGRAAFWVLTPEDPTDASHSSGAITVQPRRRLIGLRRVPASGSR